MSKNAVILLSRQHLRPSLADEWVRKLTDAVCFVKKERLRLISSVGTPNWEIITSCAILNKVPLQIVLPAKEKSDFESIRSDTIDEFNLKNYNLEFDNSVQQYVICQADKELMKARDEAIVEKADLLIPVSIRASGNMSALLAKAASNDKRVLRDYETEYDKSDNKLAYRIDRDTLSDKIKAFNGRYLIHWTRSCNSPWPHEQKLEYYNSILNAASYPRTAFETLQNILRSKTIIASSRNMPDKVKTVSFSSLKPVAAAMLMRWRARYHQMSFEPYGIGIECSQADAIGIKEVRYYDPSVSKRPDSNASWLWQSVGRKTDWSNENEYRIRGDLNLGNISKEKLVVICHYKIQADAIQDEFEIKAVWYCD